MRVPLTVAAAWSGLVLATFLTTARADQVAGTQYARFRVDDREVYGIVQGQRVREIDGDLFGEHRPTERTHALADVELLVPTEPRQVFALAGNYLSHMTSDTVPEKFKIPQPFLKTIGSLVPHEHPIIIPHDASDDVHYEAELVIVIGRTTRNVSEDQALEYVFGVTAGNDVSERFWQNDPEHRDVQWWRAKGADTFGVFGPDIVTGLEYDQIELRARVNGQEVQHGKSDELILDIPEIVRYVSAVMTLVPGDVIFTGTPGSPPEIHPGDVVEIEITGSGVLRNAVAAEQ